MKQLEDKVRLLQTTKDDLQLQCNQQTGMISDLQSKNSNLSLELESMRRRLEDLNVVRDAEVGSDRESGRGVIENQGEDEEAERGYRSRKGIQ